MAAGCNQDCSEFTARNATNATSYRFQRAREFDYISVAASSVSHVYTEMSTLVHSYFMLLISKGKKTKHLRIMTTVDQHIRMLEEYTNI